MTASQTLPAWDRVGNVAARSLVDARLQLHHAAQIIVSAAISCIPARADDSHTNMEWLPELKALATNLLPGDGGLRFALRLEDLTLLALARDKVGSRFILAGRTTSDGVAWMSGEIERNGFDPASLTTKKHYEIPVHAVAGGEAYRAGPAGAFAELSRYYHDAWLAATSVQQSTTDASDPRCWPHHFDLATLITLKPAADGSSRTIGVGLSPGDSSYDEPYFYVGPYPYPARASLAELSAGRWHTDRWLGAVLTGTELAGVGDGSAQQQLVDRFVREAVASCRRALLEL